MELETGPGTHCRIWRQPWQNPHSQIFFFQTTQRGAAWPHNKSQCGWQGDCTFQLDCSGVGLAPDHQMLQADGQGGSAGSWLLLKGFRRTNPESRPGVPAAWPSLRSRNLCRMEPAASDSKRGFQIATTRNQAQPTDVLLSTEAFRVSSLDGLLEQARLHLLSDPEGLSKCDSFAN